MTTSKNLIYGISKLMSGHGHYKIQLHIEFEDEQLTISTRTTNMRAIDGHDGGDQSLAKECLTDNDFDYDEFDLSSLDGGDNE